MTMFQDELRDMKACGGAIQWVGDRTAKQAWADCHRADWMLWLAGRMIGKEGWPSHQDVVRSACDCAEMAMKLVDDGGSGIRRRSVDAARAWADRPCDETRAAATATVYHPSAAVYYATAYYATASAYYATVSATTSIPFSVSASACYASSSCATASVSSRNRALAEMADMVRDRLSLEVRP